MVQELRQISDLEKFVKALIKNRYTELAVLEEQMWKQRAKVKWELEGDKNTKFYHAYASARRRNNFIGPIQHNGTLCATQKMKADAFFEFYVNLMGKEQQDIINVDWRFLYPQPANFLG